MIRLLRSAAQDLDSLAHVGAIRETADVREDRPVQAEWSLIARAAATLWTARDDLLVTIGDAALCAAGFAPSRATIHVPVGTPTPRELALLTSRLTHAHVVVATRTAARALVRGGVDRSRVTLVAIDVPVLPTRADARRTLGLDDATTLVHVPGRIGPDSGHRLALYACAILAYAEPAWRHLASPRGDVGHAERFVASVVPTGVVQVARGVDDATLAAAADVTLFCPAGAPEHVAIDAALASDAAIVAPATLWRRERLPVDARVQLFEGRKARTVARAMLDARETIVERRRSIVDPSGATRWSSILDASRHAIAR